MSKQQHSITQHVFRISYPNKDKAPALQQKLIQLFKQKLYPALAIYIDQYLDPNETIQIDSLVLDAGNITIEDLENELSERVMQLFKTALKGCIINPQKANNETATQKSTIPLSKESDFELVAYYLLNGILPSWVESEAAKDPSKIIEQLLLSNPQLFIQLLYKIGQHAAVRLRITRQLPVGVICNIIRQLSPTEAEFIISYHKQLSKAQLDKQLVKAETAIFKQKVWEFILEFLLVKQSSVFSRQVFVKTTLTNIAAYFNISFEEILRFFYELLKDNGAATLVTASLQHIIISIGEELPDLKQPEPKNPLEVPAIKELQPGLVLNKKQLEAISYFLLQGTLPWWAKSNPIYDPAKLLLHLSKDEGRQLHNLFSTISPINQVAKNLSFLPAEALHALVALLEPSNSMLVIKYVQEFNSLLTKAIIIGADKNYTRQKVWERTFYYLLNNSRVNFNENEYANSVLHQLSIDLKINFQLLNYKNNLQTIPLLQSVLSALSTINSDNSALQKNEQSIYLAAIDYYLRNDTFPIWAFVTSHTHANIILKELLKIHPSQTISLLQLAAKNNGVVLRLLKIADANTVDIIIRLLIPAQHVLVTTYLHALLTMPTNTQNSLGMHKHDLYKMVLEYLFLNKSNFDKEEFLLHSFKIFNRHNGSISIQVFHVYIVQHVLQKNNADKQLNKLLDTLAAVKPVLTTMSIPLVFKDNNSPIFSQKATQDVLVINESKNNTAFIKEDKKQFYNTILDVLKYYTLYKNLPPRVEALQQLTPNQLLEELLVNDTERVKQLFKFAGSSEAMMDFWLLQFEIHKTEKILRLFPQSTNNFAFINSISTLFNSPFYTEFLSVEKTAILLIKMLWQAYNKTGYSKVDTADFIIQFVKQYEFELHIPEGYLQTDLIIKITEVLVKDNFSFIAGKLQLHNRKPVIITQADKQLLLKTALINYQLLNQHDRFTSTITAAISVLNFFLQGQKFPDHFNSQLLTVDEMQAALINLLAKQAPDLFKQLVRQLVIGSVSWHIMFKQVAKNSYLANGYLQLFIQRANTNKFLENTNLIATENTGLTMPEFLWMGQNNPTGNDDNFYTITASKKEAEHPLKINTTAIVKDDHLLIIDQGLPLPMPLNTLKNSSASEDNPEMPAQNLVDSIEQIPLPDALITFRDIEYFLPKPNDWGTGNDYLIDAAEELLNNFLLYDRLPADLSNCTAAVKESWLNQLLVFISKKKPSLLGYLLQQQNHLAQNSILLHRIFSNGQDIAGRTILTVLNQFIEKDIARVISTGSKIVGDEKNIRELLDQLKDSVSIQEWTVVLTKLITTNKQLIYYLPNYLQPAEIQAVVQLQLSNEQSNYLRQLGVLLQHSQVQSANHTDLVSLYHAFMLQYTVESKRGNLADIVGYFLVFVEKENDTILFILLPVLLDVVVLNSDDLLFIKPIITEVEKIIITHANGAASNKLLQVPFTNQNYPKLLPSLTNPMEVIKAESKIIYPIKPIETNELMNEKIHINNAGIILFAPLLGTYFSRLSMLKDGEFITESDRERAVHLLAYIVDGLPTHEEHVLVLNKILCNMPLAYAITDGIELTNIEIEVTAQLYGAMQQQWPQIKNSSFDGFRVSFLQREGILSLGEEGWNLVVEQKSYDVLLQTLPWGYGMIKTPWMDKILNATWT